MPAGVPPVSLALELRDVSKYFGDLPALKQVNLRVEPGESVLLYGPNGAGKTTLLRTLACLSRPSQGRVIFRGEDLLDNPAGVKGRIGFVSHDTFLYGELTAYENLAFAGTLFRLPDLSRKIDTALDLLAVRGRAREPVRMLSRGLQQRATLARAMLHDPDFLLLDEPFTGLDTATVNSFQSTLARLTDQAKAVILSTHDFAQGTAITKRLVLLRRGRVSYDGPLSGAPVDSLGLEREERR